MKNFYGIPVLLLLVISYSLSFSENLERIQLPVFAKKDRLAADEKSALYKTGSVDPAVYLIPSSVNDSLRSRPGTVTINAMLDILLSGTNDQFIKAKRIHDWMTENIAYDSDLLIRMKNDKDPDGSTEPLQVLRYGRSNCDGLAATYELLAATAGLETRYITGRIKRSENRHGNLTNHAWNLVKLEGKWYIVDCSADSRFYYTGGKFGKKMDYASRCDHLFISPEAKRIAYLANEPNDQLCEKILSYNDFLSSPRLEIGFCKYGLELRDAPARHIYRYEKKGGGADLYDLYKTGNKTLIMSIKSPDDVCIDVNMQDNSGKRIPDRSFSCREKGVFICSFSPAGKGLYYATIMARSLSQPEVVNQVYSFYIESDASADLVRPAVVRSYYADILGIKLVRYSLNAVKTIEISYDYPEEVSIVTFVNDPAGKNIKGAVKTVYTSSGSNHIYTLPSTGCSIIVSGKKKNDNSGRGNQRLFTIDADRAFQTKTLSVDE